MRQHSFRSHPLGKYVRYAGEAGMCKLIRSMKLEVERKGRLLCNGDPYVIGIRKA